MALKHSIEEMCELARERGGRCLSSVYVSNKTKLVWQCSQKHEWEAIPATVLNGHWCPECYGNKRKTIGDMQALAKKRGGAFASDVYSGVMEVHSWRCHEGHPFEARPNDISDGHWCPQCYEMQRAHRQARTYTIDDLRAKAHARAGICLSSTYGGIYRKLAWQCAHGHIWEAEPKRILLGQWCRQCALDRRRERNAS